MDYCTTTDVLDRIRGVDLSALGDSDAQTAALEAAVADATSEVDLRCRRTFTPPTEPETRLLDGPGGFVLRVADMVRLDSVAINGIVLDNAYAYPNAGPPFGWIATGGRFPCGRRNIAVTGLWGFRSEVPTDVMRATACLAACEMLGRIQAVRSDGVLVAVTGMAREQYPEAGPYGDSITVLETKASMLLVPYRRWCV